MAIPVHSSKAAAAQLPPAPLSWGCHPRHGLASQTDPRYFRRNKPERQSKTHSRPQKPNRASTGKTGPYLTPCSPLTHARNGSQLKSPVFGNLGYPDVDPESRKRGRSSEGTWEAHAHTRSLCTRRHRGDPFWGEKTVPERSTTATELR